MSFFFNILASSSKVISGSSPSETYSPESLSVFSHFSGDQELTTLEKNALNRFIKGMVASECWTKIKGIQLLCGLSSEEKALIDLKSGIAGVNNGAEYNPSSGFFTNGTSTFINSNLIPSSGLTKDNIGISVFVISGGLAAGAISSSPTANQLAVNYNSSTRSINTKVASSTTFTKTLHASNPNEGMLVGGKRNEAGLAYLTYNGDIVTVSTTASSGVPDVPVYVGAQNFNGATSFASGNHGALILMEAALFDYAALNFYLNQLLTELGVLQAEPLYNVGDEPSYDNSEILLLNSEGQSNSLFAGAGQYLNYPELAEPITGANMHYSYPLGSVPVKGDLEYMVNHSNDGNATTYTGFAAGLRLSKELASQSLEYHIWAYNKSGTPLKQVAGKDWNAASTGEYLDESNYIGGEIIDSLTKPIKKLVWHWNQGEGDGARTQAEYTADLYAFLNAKINFYESKGIDFQLVDFHVIITQIWSGIVTSYPDLQEIIDAQQNFSKADFEAAYPLHAGKIISFVVYDNDKTYHGDNVHVEEEGYHTEGYRLANYIKKL